MARTVVVIDIEDNEEYGRAVIVNGRAILSGFADVRQQYETVGIPDFSLFDDNDQPRFVKVEDGNAFLDVLLKEYHGAYVWAREV